MSDLVNVSRRDFLCRSLLAGGGLVLGLHLPALAKGQGPGQKDGPFALNAFVRVGSDDSVCVVVNHSEMGQGIYTSMPMVVAEELDAEWAKVRFEAAPVAAVYNHPVYGAQLTGGSSSTWVEWERVRKAGATARAMLILAAAQQWNVDANSCESRSGVVSHPPTGRSLSYGELAAAAARLPVPSEVAFKDQGRYSIIGKPTLQLDGARDRQWGTAVRS